MVDELALSCCSGTIDLSFAAKSYSGDGAIKDPFTLTLRGLPGAE
jgi:hypothetical protein